MKCDVMIHDHASNLLCLGWCMKVYDDREMLELSHLTCSASLTDPREEELLRNQRTDVQPHFQDGMFPLICITVYTQVYDVVYPGHEVESFNSSMLVTLL